MKIRKLACLSAAVLFGTSTNSRAVVNLLINGSFEEPYLTQAEYPHGWRNYTVGQSFPGWTVGKGSVDVVSYGWELPPTLGVEAWEPAEGYQSLDLNGFVPGSIYQDITTQGGNRYRLRFALSGNPVGGGNVVFHMQFFWQGNFVDALSFNAGVITGGDDMHWTYYEYTLVTSAYSDLTRLSFESTSNTGSRGPALDDVSLFKMPDSPGPEPVPVPEPSTCGLIAAVLLLIPLGLDVMRQRRSK